MRRQKSLRVPVTSLMLFVLLYSACKTAPTPIPSIAPSAPAVAPTGICTPSGGYDPTADSDIIVAGWIQGWQGKSHEPTNTLESINPRIDIRQVFKGDGIPNTLSFTDNGSLIYGSTLQWGGIPNSCGAFDFDPTGHYAILGLTKGENGEFYSSRSRVFFIGKEPQGEQYTQVLHRLDTFAVTGSP